MMADPTWGGVDFGFGNNDSSAMRSFVQVLRGPMQPARQYFAFPGINGLFSQALGRRGQSITWRMTTLAKTDDDFQDLIDAINAAADAGPQEMVVEGVIRPQVVLTAIGPYSAPREPLAGVFAFGVSYDLQFLDLTAE